MKRHTNLGFARLITLFLPLLLLSVAEPLHARQATLVPDVFIVALGLEDNRATETLLEAALYFSGTTAERTASTRELMLGAMERARALRESEPDEYSRGEAIVALMHGGFLKRYGEYDTTLDAAMLEGRYNCVSSAVLFMLLAREAGLDTRGEATKDHAFCTVYLSDGKIVDVETTNPHGWDPGSKKAFQDSFGKTTGFSYVPPANYAARSELQEGELVILIAHNRSTILERQAKWSMALTLTVDVYAFWPSAKTLELLVDRINNYVADLARREAWVEALQIVEKAESLHGSHPKLEKLLATAGMAILGGILREGDSDRSLAAIREAEGKGWLGATDRNEMLTLVFTKKAEIARKSGGWLAAWQMLAESASVYPGIAALGKVAELSRVNWTYEVHNKFAGLYNAKKFAAALAVLDDALSILPAEKLFLEDRKAAMAALKQ